jgi:hypothetical protein
LLFDLDDILKCKGIPIPTFLADQFSVQIQISHNGMLGPIDHTLAPYANAASCYVVLSNVEFHYYYWSISQQTVDAIKQSAALLESDGHAFGMSFKTKRVNVVNRAVVASQYSYEHSAAGSILSKMYITFVD